VRFVWDDRKSDSNKRKHGLSFDEAMSCFYDPLHLLISDPDPASGEERMILIGMSSDGRLLVVVHIEKTESEIRLISARKATKRERRQYEEV